MSGLPSGMMSNDEIYLSYAHVAETNLLKLRDVPKVCASDICLYDYCHSYTSWLRIVYIYINVCYNNGDDDAKLDFSQPTDGDCRSVLPY